MCRDRDDTGLQAPRAANGKFDDGDVIVVTANVEFKQVTEDNPGGMEWTYTDQYGAQYLSMDAWDLTEAHSIDPQLARWLYNQKYSGMTNDREQAINQQFLDRSGGEPAIAWADNGGTVGGYKMGDGSYYWDTDNDGRMDTHTRVDSWGDHWQNTGNNWVRVYF